MKCGKKLALALASVMLFNFTGCGSTGGGQATEAAKTTVSVFAAASLQETLTEIKELYETDHPDVELVLNFESSGTLKTQIEEGADCDLFISAAQKQMDELETGGFLDPDSRQNLLENQVVLAVPSGNPANVTGFDQLAERLNNGELLLAMGNSDVPVGQYTQKIFDYYGLNEAAIAAAGSITYGSNVKEVTAQVAEGSADCGVVYRTDAFSAELETVDQATAEMCGQVVYPAAALNGATDAARAFLEYLSTDAAMAVFASVGFTPAA